MNLTKYVINVTAILFFAGLLTGQIQLMAFALIFFMWAIQ